MSLSSTTVKDPANDKVALKIVEHNSGSTPEGNNYDLKTQQRINRIEYFSQGYGPVNTLGLLCVEKKECLKKNGILQNGNSTFLPVVLNWDGAISPVIHQINDPEILDNINMYGNQLWADWAANSAELV